MTRHLVIFARLPHRPVKKRLAAGIGEAAAVRFYRDALRGALRRLRGPWTCWLLLTPDRGALPPGWSAGWTLRRQGQGDLGRRMATAFASLPPGPLVLVGSDIPDLGAPQIAAAFTALRRVDAVFGPATDGGYWLVGLRRRTLARRLFDRVRWSSRHALADTLANLPATVTPVLLESLSDIDDAAAWRAWQARKGKPGQP